MYYKGFIINVIMLDDACGVPGSIHHNKDDSYSIFIDASLDSDKQREVFLHELSHITNGDFEKKDVQEIENRTHKMLDLCPAI